MPRVFATLAVSNLLLLIASGVSGLLVPKFGPDRHVLLAVLTLIFSSFVQVVTFTYFTVTGKMIGQAVHLARLDAEIITTVKAYKRSVTRSLALVFVTLVLITATGASRWRSEAATPWHFLVAFVVLSAHLWVFVREYEVVFSNSKLVERTLRIYEEARNSDPAQSELGTGEGSAPATR